MPDLTPEELARQLEREAVAFGGRAQSLFLLRAAGAMKTDVRENFNTRASPDGVSWAPLKFPRPNSKGGDVPLIDKGLLRGSLVTTGQDHIENLTATSVEIGSTRPGANLLHAGGTVVPTNAKALAIPLTVEASRAGRPRNFPRQLFVLWRAGAKSGVLTEATTKGRGKKKTRGILAQFALVKSVTVPARPFIGFGQRLITNLNSIFAGVVKELFRKGGA